MKHVCESLAFSSVSFKWFWKELVGYERWLWKEPVCNSRCSQWHPFAFTRVYIQTVHWSKALSKSGLCCEYHAASTAVTCEWCNTVMLDL